MNKYKIQEGKFYIDEQGKISGIIFIVQALETTNSYVFSGAVVTNHSFFEVGYVGNWYTGNFIEIEYTKQVVQNDLFPIY